MTLDDIFLHSHWRIHRQNFPKHAPPPPPRGTQFFCFHIHFNQKAHASTPLPPSKWIHVPDGKSWIRPCTYLIKAITTVIHVLLNMFCLFLFLFIIILLFFWWQPSQSLILGPAHNQFGAADAPILDFGH